LLFTFVNVDFVDALVSSDYIYDDEDGD